LPFLETLADFLGGVAGLVFDAACEIGDFVGEAVV
jgi:hypothetical protein